MNKGIIASLVVIAALLVVIIVSRIDMGSGTVEMTRFDQQPDRLVIQGPGDRSLTLEKKDQKWYISPGGFPADQGKVGRIISSLQRIDRLELVSEKGFLRRYGLDKTKRITVTLTAGDKKHHSLGVGKTSPSMSHTFVLYGDKTRVYQAPGSFRDKLDTTVDSLRDRVALNVQPDNISSFSITRGGRTFKFTKTTVEQKIPAPSKGGKERSIQKDKWTCAGYDTMKLDTGKISALLRNLSPLRAKRFPAEDEPTGPETVKLELARDDGSVTVTLFGQDREKGRFVRISGFPWLVTIEPRVAEKFFITGPQAFMGK